MLYSNQMDHKFGALLAINKIVRIGRETRIIHNVKMIMPAVQDQLEIDSNSNNVQLKEMVERAADCLGILAEAGGKITAEAVD